VGEKLAEGVIGFTTTSVEENNPAEDMPIVPLPKPYRPKKVLPAGCLNVDPRNNKEVSEPKSIVGFDMDTL